MLNRSGYSRDLRTGTYLAPPAPRPFRMKLSLLLRLLATVLVGCAVPQRRVPAEEAWEPARLEQMRLAVKQAGERRDLAEAERLCVIELRYVSASTVRSVDEYSSLLA